jgi:hypothetical protein
MVGRLLLTVGLATVQQAAMLICKVAMVRRLLAGDAFI